MIELQTNVMWDAIHTLDFTWVNHEFPAWVALLFAFTQPSAWSKKLTGIVTGVLGLGKEKMSNSNEE